MHAAFLLIQIEKCLFYLQISSEINIVHSNATRFNQMFMAHALLILFTTESQLYCHFQIPLPIFVYGGNQGISTL